MPPSSPHPTSATGAMPTRFSKSTGQIMLNSDQAVALAGDYLADVGRTAEVTVAADQVSVTVTVTVNAVLLPVGEMVVSATETATAVTEEPET